MRNVSVFVFCDKSIEDNRFVDNMWEGNLGYLAYTNGVYSFEDRRLMTLAEAKGRKIYFIHDTKRAYNAEVDPELKKEVHRRIFEGFMADAEQLEHYLSSLARALAGRIGDKTWNSFVGGRDCGKSLQTKTLMNNAENLLTKDGVSQDAAKAQSWIKDFEYKRIIFTNEMPKDGKQVMDGEKIKRICSAGDHMEVRQNYTNEIRIQAQATFFLFANATTEVSPDDAYTTMQGWKLDLEYHNQSEFDDKSEQGECPPAHWRVKDPSIVAYILRGDVLDAVTSIIFDAYTSEKQAPPQRVKDDTDSIKGPASESVEERFTGIIIKGGTHDFLSYSDIQNAMKDGGMEPKRHDMIDTLVKREYNIVPQRQSKKNELGKSVQIRGFKGLKINTCYTFNNPN
jgi:hypothetical protein